MNPQHRKTHKGQFTIVALILTLITVIAFVVLYPVLDNVISDNLSSMDATTQTIVKLIPAFIALAIVASMWFFVVPQRQERI